MGSAPLKRRSKRRSALTVMVGGKAGRLAGKPAVESGAALTGSSDSEGCVSDSSDLSHTQQAA